MTGLPKAEMDQILVDREQMNIAEIFAEKGEPYFRAQETELLKEFGSTGPQIVSCGGGVALNEENVEEMRRTGKIICLTATPDVIYERVKDSRERPLLNGNMNVEYIRGSHGSTQTVLRKGCKRYHRHFSHENRSGC